MRNARLFDSFARKFFEEKGLRWYLEPPSFLCQTCIEGLLVGNYVIEVHYE